MFKIQTLNAISDVIHQHLAADNYIISNDEPAPEGILVRSAAMHDMELPQELLAIARAGAGTNNIPIDKCTEKGIVVFNTPNTYGIYMAKLGFEWLLGLGGVDAIYEQNKMKAALLYDYLDESKLFKAAAQKEYRSLMNVTFVTGDADKDAAFVKYAAANGLVNLKGHRSVGGMRASIYNAMPVAGVQKLVEVMKAFEKENA